MGLSLLANLKHFNLLDKLNYESKGENNGRPEL
jgi:hypothetical protein